MARVFWLMSKERVFEAFYRSPEAQEGGSGLGLAIVREIARAHGAWWNLLEQPAAVWRTNHCRVSGAAQR
jgi:nitrogen fixation/metabolism regulation signal transduction histidine kinase